MMNIIKIFKSEFITMLKDPGSLLVMVLGVFLYTLFYTIPFANHIVKEVPIAVIDNDNSEFSRELIRNLNSSEYLNVIYRPLDVNSAKEEYYKNNIRAYIIIPKDFEKDIKRGTYSQIALFQDSAYLIIYKQITTGVMTTVGTMSAKFEIGKLMKKGINKQLATAVKLPVDFIQIPLFNPAGSYMNYIYPMVLILILQQTLLVGAGLLGGTARELMQGVKRRTKEGVIEIKNDYFCEFSNNPIEIVLGKSFAYVSLYFLYSLFCFLIFPAIFCYEMTYNILLWLILLVPFLFSTAFLAQTLVYFYSTREHSLLMLVVTSLPMIFLPGFVWPKEAMSWWLIAFSKFIPATSAIDGLVRVNQMGAGFSHVKTDIINLYLLCLLYFVLACLVIKKMQKSDIQT